MGAKFLLGAPVGHGWFDEARRLRRMPFLIMEKKHGEAERKTAKGKNELYQC